VVRRAASAAGDGAKAAAPAAQHARQDKKTPLRMVAYDSSTVNLFAHTIMPSTKMHFAKKIFDFATIFFF
jgi:hypothetical protein